MVTAGRVAVGVVATGVGWLGMYRSWHLRWGATPEEVARSMPGDGIVPAPTFNATRAVTVHARPEAIWPWIVQIGFGRAGWYTYDVLDNLARPSADRIIPELQHIAVGDLVPMGPGDDAGMRVAAFEPDRWVLWADHHRLTTWLWLLDPTPDGNTRLITRVRSRPAWRHPSTLVWLLLFEVADFPLMRKCLLGIRRRAETRVPVQVSRPT